MVRKNVKLRPSCTPKNGEIRAIEGRKSEEKSLDFGVKSRKNVDFRTRAIAKNNKKR